MLLPALCGIVLAAHVLPGCSGSRVERAEPASFERLGDCLAPFPPSQDMGRKRRCASLLERFLESEPDDPRADDAAFRLGQIYLETGDYTAAYHVFRSFPERYPKARRQSESRLYLGVSLYFLENPTGSLEVLRALADDDRSAPWEGETFRYIAENYVKLADLPSALTWYGRCLEALKAEADRERLRRRILEVLSLGWEPEALQAAAGLFPEGFFSEAIQLGMAATRMQRGQARLAEDQLARMSTQHPNDVFTPHLKALLTEVPQEGGAGVCVIGCLLPLTGEYEGLGRNVLNAMLLGARAFRDPGEEDASIRLEIRDTQGDPKVAVQRLRELAGDPDVSGIVGPLRASEAFACAQEAQRLGIPMIALTQREEVAQVGDFVFQNGLTIRQQVDTLVEFVMEEMGLSSFAVLYPNDPYGTQSRNLLEKKVLEMGGEFVSAVRYSEGETDFQEEVRLLVGPDFLLKTKRREEQRQARKLLAEGSGTAPEGLGDDAGGTEIGEEPVLPPFQVLFIPDHFRKVALIAPHLALYDVNEITLLGTNAWNSNRLVELAGEYVRDAIFADGFFAESSMPTVREFVEDYTRAFQSEPRVLEANGYDSLLMLEDAFLRARGKSRSQVRDALAAVDGFPGLSGYTRFNEDGSANKRLYILSIVGNHIEQIH